MDGDQEDRRGRHVAVVAASHCCLSTDGSRLLETSVVHSGASASRRLRGTPRQPRPPPLVVLLLLKRLPRSRFAGFAAACQAPVRPSRPFFCSLLLIRAVSPSFCSHQFEGADRETCSYSPTRPTRHDPEASLRCCRGHCCRLRLGGWRIRPRQPLPRQPRLPRG